MVEDVEYEIVDFGGIWLSILRLDGIYLVDPTYLDEFIKEHEKKSSN